MKSQDAKPIFHDVRQFKCYRHYHRNATTICAVCGNALCDECTRRDGDLVRCQKCVYEERLPSKDDLLKTRVTSTILCPVCGMANPLDSIRCQNCEVYFDRIKQSKQVEKEMVGVECRLCHTLNTYGLNNCQKCGVKLDLVIRLTQVGFWHRLWAYLIDWIIGLVLGLFLFPFPLVGILVSAIYCIGFWAWRGQTPGKMALGIKIVKTNGTAITFGNALARYIGYWVSAIPLGLGFLWVAWDSRKQGWHDKIAQTYVVLTQEIKELRLDSRHEDVESDTMPPKIEAEVISTSGYWYYYDNGKKGPVPIEKLKELYQKGIINNHTVVWTDEMKAGDELAKFTLKDSPIYGYIKSTQ